MASQNALSKYGKIDVKFNKRPDGGLTVSADALPGFFLSHSDCDAVFEDVKPALEYILSNRFKTIVEVEPLHDIAREMARDGFVNNLPEGCSNIEGTKEYLVLSDGCASLQENRLGA